MKIDQDKTKPFNRFKSRICEKKEDRYVKTISKIQVTAIFLMQDTRKSFLPNFWRFAGRRHTGALPNKHQGGGWKPRETFVTAFCSKSVDLSFEALKNTQKHQNNNFANTRTVQISKFLGITNDSSLGRHVNPASRKSLEIQAYSITKPRTHLKRKFV